MGTRVLVLLALTAHALAAVCTEYSTKRDCSAVVLRDTMPACGAHRSHSNDTTAFAIVGDFGLASAGCEADAFDLFNILQDQFGEFAFVATTGDNNYWEGACESYQSNVAQYYAPYYSRPGRACVNPPRNSRPKQVSEDQKALMAVFPSISNHTLLMAEFGAENVKNRFFPTLGNHDWDTYSEHRKEIPYLQVFDYLSTLDSSESDGTYYTVEAIPGQVQLFMINSNVGGPGANDEDTLYLAEQKTWLQSALQNSTARFKFVSFHHPPFCTAQHDPLSPHMDWPFEKWGASAVFNGHQHVYERIQNPKSLSSGEGMPYIVHGLGGHPWLYDIHDCDVQKGSKVRYNGAHGVVVGLLQGDAVDFCFYSIEDGGKLVDHFTL